MKKLTFLLSISIYLVACGNDSESSSGPEYVWVDPSTVIHGTMTDSRDGKTYKTVTIGSQTWMAENLNSSEQNIYHAFALELDYRVLEPAASDDALISGNHKTWAYSVRCVKD